MSEPFLGEIRCFGFNFAPRGWGKCNGQLLPIPQNSALFSLLGTQYGGDGRTTFGIPDLQGRVAMHMGDGAGLSNYRIGQKGGTESVTLTTRQIPSHTHQGKIRGTTSIGSSGSPAGRALGGSREHIYADASPTTDLAANTISVEAAGGSAAHTNVQPFLVVNWCIALVGVFPSRS